jgi:hypothetical protein
LRKVINGRTYNTATSKLIGGNSIHSLYKNTKGAYFLYMGEAKVIDPLSDEEAQAWAKKHLDIDLSATSEEPASDLVTRERVNLTLDAEIIANLRELSGKNGIPMARMVDRAIVYLYGEQFKELKKAPN